MYQLVNASYGATDLVSEFYSFGEAYGRACDMLRSEDVRLQIIKEGIVKWDSRDR
jgi:hypothetical protein